MTSEEWNAVDSAVRWRTVESGGKSISVSRLRKRNAVDSVPQWRTVEDGGKNIPYHV